MQLPFTTEQFFDVFRQYNEAVWPAQVGLNLLALAAIGLLVWRRRESDRWISAMLAVLWAWTGIAYQWAFFSAINKAAFLLGVYADLGLLIAGMIAIWLLLRPATPESKAA